MVISFSICLFFCLTFAFFKYSIVLNTLLFLLSLLEISESEFESESEDELEEESDDDELNFITVNVIFD